MRCAERTGTCLMLWQHEFYMVMEARHGAYLYQALEFQVGTNLPPVEVEGVDTKAEEGGLGARRGVCPFAACEEI